MSSGDIDRYLKERGTNTLLFSGVNSDQCVLGTIQDASHKGYDTILLNDSSATNSSVLRDRLSSSTVKSHGVSCHTTRRCSMLVKKLSSPTDLLLGHT